MSVPAKQVLFVREGDALPLCRKRSKPRLYLQALSNRFGRVVYAILTNCRHSGEKPYAHAVFEKFYLHQYFT